MKQSPSYPPGPAEVPHRKNAAEWVMWAFWFPATRLARWFEGLPGGRQWAFGVGVGCVIGGILQGASVGRGFLAVGLSLIVLAFCKDRPGAA